MKKAVSLIEILISITIFSFILLSIYKTIEISQNDINRSIKLIDDVDRVNHIKSIFLEDFLESEKIIIEKLGTNHVLKMITYNNYHNLIYTNITYMIDEDRNLYRIESNKPISEKNIYEMNIKNLHIDLVFRNVTKFKVEQGKNKNYFIYINRSKKNEFSLLIPFTIN